MAKPTDKDSAKKPLVALSRKAIAGWVVVVFIISGWMFGLGVMVGRGIAPVSFDVDQLKRKLESLQKSDPPSPRSSSRPEPTEMKNKTDLGFYESLPKNREETDLPNISPPPQAARQEPGAQRTAEGLGAAKTEKPAAAAAAAPAPPPSPAPAAPGKPFTVQVSAVKTEEEARHLLDRLRQRGYAAYIEPISIPDKGTWYRVRMGEFPSKEFAKSTVDRLQKDGFAPMVVPK
ncbi:MAG: SPOR domain-containing protein [Hyphomicrobiales bacterium]